MPKQVDHDRRRAEIAEATWRLIAERGIDGTTMRAISAALGMAHGALKHYFPDKNSIIRTAFTHVFDSTNTRIRERLGDATGLAALRIFCLEAVPVEEVTILEARVVLPFWQRALADAELESVFVDAMSVWREQILRFLRQGRADGSVRTMTDDEVVTEQLLALLNGAQVLGTLTPRAATPKRQHQMIDAFLDGLRR
ncbi:MULTISPECIES: TetR/AcrR family transcriptional regulator [Amycolatopsis]|uniref:DNA-binding transcriptional regulator, AcrR family n=2 Tax=Amycolatopsis TaxID=1813 RepID=A0A1I3VK25_9PSEU|nr:TetR/AcrR family transcriptional regulator [Amycolatopsis sacchari]SFJ94481.1 DNA-binding transcriptional regulator, AcrR family [Amycolatopsis sacchari]